MPQRNPYTLLGVRFGASRDVATEAFAKRAKRLRRTPGGADHLTDLTWALNQVDEVLKHPELALHVFRVPADESALVPDHEGVLNPAPEPLPRATTSTEAEHAQMREAVGHELVTQLAIEVGRQLRLPER